MTRAVTGNSQRFRTRKIGPRQNLVIYREHQVEAENATEGQKIETGVEATEEEEHHLQAAIASQAAAIGGKVAQIYIPTPETVQAQVKYDDLYPLKFSQPATYIRFSSTVEDCSGCPYNMSEEDDDFLKIMNERGEAKVNASLQCTEDQFEEVMNFFEESAKTQQPFSAVGDPPVLTWKDMEGAFDETLGDAVRPFAKDIYEHWSRRRKQSGNNAIQPGLKLKVIESNTDADDSDPYVCFRRREVRTVRKTRGRDAQSADKLKKLRKELEEARHLVALVKTRENTKIEQLLIERQVFEQRTSLRHLKRNLPDQFREGDEELLVNQRPQKKKALEVATSQRTPTAQMRLPPRPDGRTPESDLMQLSDVLAEKENRIEQEIKLKVAQHAKWNEHHVDMTREPVRASKDIPVGSGFRAATTQYLPTPPASVSSDHSGDGDATDPTSPSHKPNSSMLVRYTTPPQEDQPQQERQPSFRRRIGRGGRMLIDRRGVQFKAMDEVDQRIADRFKYDRDSDDDDDQDKTYYIDPFDINNMRYRAAISASNQPPPQPSSARRSQIEPGSSLPPDTSQNPIVVVAPAPPSTT